MPYSQELFYLDENGKQQDASLHAELLDNPEAEASADRLAAEWWAEQLVKKESKPIL